MENLENEAPVSTEENELTNIEKNLIRKYIIGITFLLLIFILFVMQFFIPKKSSTKIITTNYSATKTNNKKKNIIGDNIYYYNDLNLVALDKDCVFLFIPSNDTVPVQEEIKKAILDAQILFNSQGIKTGIYTLNSTAPDYAIMVKQVTLPALLVTSKGKGMAFVSGTITRDSIMQTFIKANVTSTSGGCLIPGDGSGGCTP